MRGGHFLKCLFSTTGERQSGSTERRAFNCAREKREYKTGGQVTGTYFYRKEAMQRVLDECRMQLGKGR